MRAIWKGGNRFELLPEGKRFWPAMRAAIEGAREQLWIELYLMESGALAERFVQTLEAAVARGVAVRMMLDGVGSMGLARRDRQRLRAAGVELRFFNPLSVTRLGGNLMRDHRKLVVVDGEVAFTGGFGIVDEFVDAWYEVAVRVEGPVVHDWMRLFAQVWDSPLTRGGRSRARLSPHLPPAPQEVVGEGARGRVISGRGHRYQAIRLSLHGRISTARQRLWLCTPYFVPTLSLRRQLAQAARRGIDVRLLLAGGHHDHPGIRYAGQRFYGRLLKAGVQIYEFQPNFIHAKFCVVDDWVSLGSCNFDHWSLQWNLEANQEIEDSAFAAEVAQLFQRNFAASQRIDAASWRRRPWWQRVREWAFGTLNAWMTRLK
ncbi:phosphatidylserine/phosphatidylglycerophosphate/cardiolipin synthase family protein [Salinicola sp. JS01]|uniref:phospholipase D-like domain-containing protein n=1 Tax=Salinicola sp. JS01 TaxID=3050071 RepID=UPI00255BB3FC|nr:phosphatidylserine/phosphatidylglycerophosphate/cardiolipin synthase family protein [Salinicola sp. JS01]WIX33858.1 phosphatidylserine/phosphatidylglycerophosphate/cardiolipin synthase family protein [Salinicola sp. JS01]